MKILLDENISWRIIKELADSFNEVFHVNQIFGKRPMDTDIWNYARENQFMIITYDSDFIDISELRGAPPKIIWFRFGNASRNYIINKIKSNIDRIKELYNDDELNILEIY